MGWAKYYEDNVEIMYDRQAAEKSQSQETSIRFVCADVFSVAKIIVEIKEERIATEKDEYHDKFIVCKDCGRKFLFTAKTQKHYDKMGWDDPKRCKECRNYRNTRFLMCSSF